MDNLTDRTTDNHNFQLLGNSTSTGDVNHDLASHIFGSSERKDADRQLSATQFEYYLNNTILPLAQTALDVFERSADFDPKLQLAFGDGYTQQSEQTKRLIDSLVRWKPVPFEILPSRQIQAKGAFDGNKIYLSEALLNPDTANSQEAVDVLLEEMGHYIDSQINQQDTLGDEGAIFAKLVQDRPFAARELAKLKAEDDRGILTVNGEKIAVERASLDPGVFVVDNTGRISVDFIADSGSFHSEMAIFSLKGMENIALGSTDFIKEAARRALSNSAQGYVVISDVSEGAKFTGELGESNRNDGKYVGVKTFNFAAEDRIAMMLVPQGTIKQIFDRPTLDGDKRPLFSISDANPDRAIQLGQLVPGTFGWEDLRLDGTADADYNDFVFQIKGASGIQTDIGQLISAGQKSEDWEYLPLAQKIISTVYTDKNHPILTASLANDTGLDNTDLITYNPRIVGQLSDDSGIRKFAAKFKGSKNYVDILSSLNSDNSFTLNQQQLDLIKGECLCDGSYELILQAEDKFGNVSKSVVKFTLDTTKPIAPIEVNIKDDLDPLTNLKTPTIAGKAETGTLVQIFDGATKLGEATAANGAWEITTTQLTDGVKNLSIQSIDPAGNISDKTVFSLTVDTIKPVISVALLKDTGASNSDKITADGTITGTVTDLNSIGKFQAKLNTGNFVDVFAKLNPDGTFSLDKATLTQISGGTLPDGIYQLILQAEDKAGNATEPVKLDFTLDTNAPGTVGFMLDSLFDSAPIGDSRTSFAAVSIIGQTEANATVTLEGTSLSVTADAQGKFKFTNVALVVGDNSFTVNAIDLAGNKKSQTGIIKRVAQASSDVVLEWNANLLNAVYEDKTPPPIASRNMAIMQAAVFDAVNSFAKTYKNYHFVGSAPAGALIEAAAAGAAYHVLISLYSQQKTFLDNAFAASLAKLTDGAAKDAGVAFGKTVAEDLLLLRSNDGANQAVTFTPTTNPGDWQPTPPALAAALLPQWGNVTPFSLTSGSQFRPAGSPALTSDRYTVEFNQVKDLGSINSTTRTTDQTQIAQFWADGAGTFTPPGHWNQIAQNVAATKGNSLLDNALLFALLDISLADAGIAAWDAKYQYNSWRPITAIQQADTDGNPNTIADPNWKPLITTPPFPEYISGHSTFSGAAATVLTSLLGDNISFNLNSLGTPGVERQFSSFNAAATEAGISRIYGGIHFNFANIDGQATGKSVGNYVLQNLLGVAKPVAPTEVKIKDDTDTITNLKTPIITGKATTGTTVQIFDGTTKLGEAVAVNGVFEITTSTLTDGVKSLTVKAVNAAGNISDNTAFSLTVSTVKPVAPTEIKIKDDTDTVTNLKTPVITGKAETGTTVQIFDGVTKLGEAIAVNGVFEITTSALTDGVKNLTVKSVDTAGNISDNTAFSLTVDTVKPVAPTEIKIKDDPDTVTNLKTPVITGKAETGTTVQIFDGVTKLGEAVAVNGAFEITTSALTDGVKNLTVKSVDTAGNVSDNAAFSLTVDTSVVVVKPVTPTEVKIKDDVDTVTNLKTPIITGKATTGNTIQIFDGTTKLGEAVAVNGAFEITTSALTDGVKNLTVKSVDTAAGTSSDNTTFALTVDTLIPTVNLTTPAANAQINTGAKLQGTVDGTGSAISRVSYRFGTGSEIIVPVNAQGQFDVELNLAGLSGQQSLILKSVDTAGNITESTIPVTVGADITPPKVALASTPSTAVNYLELTFNEPVTEASFAADKYSLKIVGGTQDGTAVTIASIQKLSPTQVRVNLAAPFGSGNYKLAVAAGVADAVGNTTTAAQTFDLSVAAARISISPANGEEMVGLNRDTVVNFGKKIDPKTVTSDNFYLIANGQRIAGKIKVSSTEEFATFFYDAPLPSSTEVRVVVDGGKITGRDGVTIDGDGDGKAGGIATADFTTLPLTRIKGTDVWGYVYDSYNKNADGSNIPLKGVTIRLDSLADVFATTDEKGYFILKDVPAPEFFVYIDGAKATGSAAASQYASLGKPFHSVPGQSTQLVMDGTPFNVYLPPMAASDVKPLSATETTQVGFGVAADAFLQKQFPNVAADLWKEVKVTFAPGSAQDDAGNKATQAMIIPVDPQRLPAPLPPGADPKLIISIQAGGAGGFNREAKGGSTNFDVPAPIQFPNLDGLKPGEKSLFWSFDHDAGKWIVIGSGTVSADGKTIISDPGVGVIAPGWHFTNPGNCAGSGGAPPKPTEPSKDEKVTNNPLQVLNLIKSDTDSTNFTSKTWNAPPNNPNTPPLPPIPGCGVPQHNPNDNNQQPFINVTIEVDGLLAQFMKPIAGGLPLESQSFTLSPGTGDTKKFGIQTMSYNELFGANIVALFFGDGFKFIEKNQFYSSKIKITEVEQKSDGSRNRTISEYELYRFIDATDDKHTDGKIEFEDALINVATREKEAELVGSISPTFTTSGAFSVDNIGKVKFTPTIKGSQTQNLQVKGSNGAVAGSIELVGKGTDVQHIYVDTASLVSTLIGIAEGTASDVRYARVSADEKKFFDNLEDDLVTAKPNERAELATDVENRIISLFSRFSQGITSAGAGAADTMTITFKTTAGRVLGDSGPAGGVDTDADIKKSVDDRGKFSKVVENFTLDKAINKNFTGTVEAYPDTLLEDNTLTRSQFINSLSKSSAHEVGHTLGLRHTYKNLGAGDIRNVRPNGSADLMKSGEDPDGTLQFQAGLTVEAIKLALNLGWTKEEAQTALGYYIKHYAEGAFDTANGFPDPDTDTQPITGPRLAVFDATGNLVSNTLGLGNITVDGTGGISGKSDLVLLNFGSEDVLLKDITLANSSSFSINGISPNTVIKPGQSLVANLIFDPLVTGNLSTALQINSNDPTSQSKILLTGFGQSSTPMINVKTTNNNLGGAKVDGGTVEVKNLATINNDGIQPLIISKIQLVEGSDAFKLLDAPIDLATNPIKLNFGESFTFGNLKFDPNKVGLSRGVIEITTNDPKSPIQKLSVVGTGLDKVVYPDWGNDYIAIEMPNLSGNAIQRIKSDKNGNFQTVLAPNQYYHMVVFDPVTGLVSHSYGQTPPSGQGIDLTASLVFNASTATDTDGDGLPDDIEFAIGTAASKIDTDGDSIRDFVEIYQGTDPLGGQGFPTGIISTLPLQGEAKAVVVSGSATNAQTQTAYVATGSHGLAIVNASRFDNPIILGQLDLPGDATSVGVDNKLKIAAVATNSGGLQLVNVADGMLPTLIKTVNLAANKVEVAEGIAYAAVGNVLHSIDLTTGDELQSLTLPGSGSVTGLAREGSKLYAYVSGSDTFLAIDISAEGSATVLGQLVVSVASSDVGLTVGNGVAYLAGSGLRTIDISKPNTPTLISNDNNNFFTARNIALNGSGLALVSSENQGLAVYNVADPQKTDAFVTILDTPGTVYDSAVASGIAFAADGSSGLQVINYLPFDNKGKAPTISISTNVSDLDPNTAGIQVQEGSTIPIRANIADDVQVRNVELLVDGQVTANDVSFPWDLSVVAPKIANGKTTVDIQVRATDTGGNISLSNLLTLNLSPDKFAPKVLVTTPAAGARSETIPSVVVTFDEAIDPTKLSVAGVTLTNLGKDGILGGGDDLVVPVISLQTRSFERTLVITPTSELPLGKYQLKLDPGTIGDRAGNSLTAPFTLDFTKRTSLTYGTTINGNLAQAGDDEVYTLKATAGSRIIFDRLLNRNTDIDIEFQLTSPSGKSITQVSTYNGYAPITLTETGNYIATVKSANNSTGDYGFRLVDTQAAPTITLGTTVTDTLSDLAELDAYQIDGKAGQRLFFNDQIEAGNNSGWNWALYGTDNQQLIKFSGRDFNDFEAVLPKDGKYLLVLTQNIPGRAIDYSFNVTSPPTTTTSLKLGDTVNSKIAELGAINEYTFTGILGQRLYFDTLIASSNIATQLIGPRGQVVFNRSASNVPFTLTEAGTYKLIFNGYGSLGDYSFRLFDAADAKPIVLGTVQRDTLTLDSGVNVYRIDGTAGQKLFFDALVAVPNGVWTLYGPNDRYLMNSIELGTDFEVTLTTDGTYLLVLSGDNVNYSFNVTNPATPITALTLGTTVTGKIARVGSEEVYTLNATAGSRIIFDRLFSTTYIPIKLQLTSPSGNSITQVSTSNDGLPVILAETGTYTATVKSYDNSTGDYSFRLVDTNTAPTITLGTTVTDTLSDLAELDAYQIDGKAGQRLFFNNLNPLIAGGNDSIWTLYGTDNQFLANAVGYKNFVTVLPNDGKYLLVLTRYSPGKAIDYNFKVTSPPTTTTVLNVGATVTNKSLELGAINEYTFTGVPGQRLYLDTLGISAQLISPSGQFVFYSDPKSPFILSEAGTYKLIFDGYSDSGTEARDYSFRLLDTAVAKPIVFGTVETDTLTPDLGGNVYRIDGKAGQKLYFDALVAANIGLWTLYAPNNQSLTSIGLDTDFEAALTTDGIYLLVINGDRVNYSFNVTNPATTNTPLTLGTTFTGKIAQPGEVNEYTFTGAVGQRLYYDGAIDNSTSTIFCQLVSPTGQIVFNLSDADLDRAPFTLTEAGTYKLTFNAYGSLGDYSFRLLDTGLATALTPGMTVTDTLTPGLEADIYRIDGKAGQKLYFDSLLTATSGTWTLYGVNNQSVASSGLGRDFETTLIDGTYFLVISGDNANGNTNYSFKVTEIEPTTQALTLGSTITSSIAQPGAINEYTFTGTTGQRLYYDGLITNNTSTIYSQLISPTGQIIFDLGDADIDRDPVTLTESGIYKLILDGYADNVGDYSFRLLNATAATRLTLNSTIAATLDPGSNTEIYRFDGTAGQKLNFDSLVTDSINANWTLYGANNQVIANNNPIADFVTTLTYDGTYFLVLEGNAESATVNYSFKVTDISAPAVTKAGFNTLKTGTIAAGATDTYTFTGAAGSLVYFDSQSPGANDLTVEVRDPSNTVLTSFDANTDTQPIRLFESGIYIINVRGNTATSTGAYSFQSIDLSTAATALTIGTPITQTLPSGSETIVYKFTGTVGQKLYYDSLQSDADTVNVQLIDPTGVTIFSIDSDNDSQLITLTIGGTYYLLLEGNNAIPSDYSFIVTDSTTTSPPIVG